MASTTEKTVKNNRTGKKINFEYFAPGVKTVEVAGSFNDWKPAPLKKKEGDKWALYLDLNPGRYEYRYLVDGNWQNDQRQVGCVPNAYGSWNCVMEVQA